MFSQSKTDIPSFTKADTYYIVDPGQTNDSCNPPTNFSLFIVASPDERHQGESEFAKLA
jgi:hypothetical protein